MSIQTHLRTLKQKLESGAFKSPYKFVTGNQSADLDSVISAISYSYLANLQNGSNYIIPLVNISRNELRLRRDIVSLLKAHSITDDLLYFTEDFSRINGAKDSHAHVILVDHCNLQGNELIQSYQDGKLDVTGIVDHHADEGVFLDANPRIIHSNGSCSAVVFNYWYKQLGSDISIFKKDPEVIELLLGPQLIDTSNMTQKVEQNDIDAYKLYLEILKGNNESFLLAAAEGEPVEHGDVLSAFYKQLKKEKKDMSGFSFGDILRKDYKQFKFSTGETVGFSSIGKSLKWVLSEYKPKDLKKTLTNDLKSLGLDLLVITSSYTQKENDQYTREFCYYYEDTTNEKFNNLAESAKDALELDSNVYQFDKIESVVAKLSDEEHIFRLYNQRKLAASRKQVVPIVKEILESSK